ncbi:MAG: uroporphyrinogen-III C-methyltransferase [Chromatiales bacterium]|nr:uroporphyrinogen-III C-methyltransferase [Chromatiales bacterium]
MSEKTEQDSELEKIETEIDGEVVDAEVSEVAEEASSDQAKAPKGGNAGAVAAILLALVAMGATGGGLWYGYQYWSKLQADLQQMNSAIAAATQQQSALQQQIDTTNQQFTAQKEALAKQEQVLSSQDKKLAAEREKLKQQGAEMQQTLESVYQRVGRNSTAWMAAEAEYLLHVANHRLRLERDTMTAIKALEEADARLRDSGDPGWIKVRETIASEIARVKAVGVLDRPGLSAKLIGMAEQVPSLKVTGTEPMPPQKDEQPVAQMSDESERNLDTLLKDTWEGFKSIMVIRHRGKPVTAMLAPDQHFFVQQNLRLKFESARMAMLRGDQALYDASLQLAKQWLSDFFETDNSAAQALLKQIDDIEGVKVNPTLPDISGSIVELRERLKQVNKGEAG